MWIVLLLSLLMTSTAWAAGSPVRVDDGDTITDQADVTVTSAAAVLIKASNSNRSALNCTTTTNVRWGSSTITITKGQLVAANSSVAIRNTGAIYMIAETDTATVSCTEETYSAASSTIFSP